MSSIDTVILDWAGTAVDCGCCAPVGVFVEVFRREGLEVSMAEAREPMGTQKREHIRRMVRAPRLAAAWEQAHGRRATDEDIDRMYANAEPLAVEVLPSFATPIPGVLSAVEQLRAQGLKIGSCTGYSESMLDVLAAAAAGHGYVPDVRVAATEVPEGRPAPDMPLEVVARLGGAPGANCVVVGDTPVDVGSGLAAGMWAVGVAATGNLVGRTVEEMEACDPEVLAGEVSRARQALYDAGAHLVIDSLAGLPAALEAIERGAHLGAHP